ncbi:hypothetical protein [Streptomyces odonnellii]|uniref:hypothetical protein n=1 Tax=Streptomyces odonnellii TaxID=1417980 RepID=UPI0006250DE8|nr:hypothetical protein [Streptomyces odonnellii]
MFQRLAPACHLAGALLRHDELRQITDIADEAEHELLTGPDPAALMEVQSVVEVVDTQGVVAEFVEMH